ncbi:MAG TPA: RIP metalloprotease RseP [candidate division Zixibacteria bacterium]|nr:RIP metalloprotease RseP [candidate division Zixibacteria bacterium]
MLMTLISFVVLLGVLIFIHELGHFAVAKKVGIRVDRFSLGFPPNIFTTKRGETEYCIGMIPLGGYVKMAGESPDEGSTGQPYEFASKKVWQRFLVIFAGPFMNYALAIVLFGALLFAYGEPFAVEEAVIGQVGKETPAASAGLLPDDKIIEIDGVPVTTFADLREIVMPRPGQALEVVWLREGDTLNAAITPDPLPITDSLGVADTVGQLGVSVKMKFERTYSLGSAFTAGFTNCNAFVGQIFLFVKDLITGDVAANAVGGPIYIAQQSGEAARQGLHSFLFLMAVLSVNLAVLNILPIPVLDGGHMVFLAIEKIKGSPLTMKARMYAQQVGMLFLMGFIVFVSWNDIMRWLPN